MSYKLIVSKDAHDDLTDITEYIARELKTRKQPQIFLTMWKKAINGLSIIPASILCAMMNG